MESRQINSTNYPIQFLMTNPADHVTGVAGLVPVVQISKNGGAFAAAAGAVSEIGNGIYSLAGNANDRDTIGELVLYATAGGADPMYKIVDIVDYNPFDIVDDVWDELLTGATHNVPTSAGRRLRELTAPVITAGTATAGTNNTITLDPGASALDGAYDPAIITISGGTGEGQSRLILQYDGATKIAVVDRNWRVNPDNTSEYVINAAIGREHVNEGLVISATPTSVRLNTDASTDDDAYNGQIIFIRSGTGEDQTRRVVDYDGGTQTATVVEWDVIPDATSAYVMLPTSTLTEEYLMGMEVDGTGDTLGDILQDIDYNTSVGLASIISTLRQYSSVYSHAKKDSIEIKRSTDVSIELYGVGDLTGRTALYFTVKKMAEKDDATDAQSIIQISEAGGLLYINKAVASNPANGSITVVDALAGTLTIELAAEESDKIEPNESYLYDLKMDNDVMVQGRFLVSTAITRTIT